MYLKLTICIILFSSFTLAAQTPCENNVADGFPCSGIDLYAHIDNNELSGTTGSVEGSDIWGWTDPLNGKEYALMAQTNGTVFIDISNPTDPIIVGRLASPQNKSSLWRDVKVYNNYAFIVADNNSGHGMQVFDLKKLRNVTDTPVQFVEDANYQGVSSAHNIVINEAKGLAYIVGARDAENDCSAGGLHIVNISNPLSPTFAGCFDADGYTHDSQVVTYHGPDKTYQGLQIAFNSNENTITIAQVESSSNTRLISKQGYTSAAYAHQGWLTEDHRYFISNDELDEYRGLVNGTRTLIWDVTDLDNPSLIKEYKSSRNTIDHNLYTHLGIVYQSNYTSGLVLLDAEEVSNGTFKEVGYFDTFPNNNSVSFNGSWSNYPYFKSGLIIVSDIDRGLFILKRSSNINSVLSQQPSIEYTENSAKVKVQEMEITDVTSYQWEVLNEDNTFTILEENDLYANVNSASLSIDFSIGGKDNLRYRCNLITSENENTYTKLSNPVKQLGTITGIINNISSSQIKMFPNPSKNYIQVDLGNYTVKATYTIYDPAGQIMLKGVLVDNRINISSIKQGAYILVLKNSEGDSFFNKFIKE